MIDRDDPRLTAYALGEMDALERAEFEKVLAGDPSAAAEVEAIRALGGHLAAELARSTAPALTEAQRASVAQAARRRVPVAILLMPLAACLIAAITFFVIRAPEPREVTLAREDREVAADAAAPETDFRGPNGTVVPGARKNEQLEVRLDEARAGHRIEVDLEELAPPPISLVGVDENARAPLYADPSKPTNRVVLDSPAPGRRAPSEPEPSPAPPADGVAAAPTTPAGPAAGEVKDGRAGGDRGGLLVGAAAGGGKQKEVRALDAWSRGDPPLAAEAGPTTPADREAYDRIRSNPFVRVADEDSSTFGIDVDTASYANVRRFLQQEHRLPPPDAVRVEEMVNYFSYAYEPPAAGSPHPFRIHVEVASCPWNAAHRLARVAIKGMEIDRRERPDSNLVFLVDVSGSMNEPNKLPLVLASLRMLAENLGERDRVAIAVYAGAAGLVLPSTGDKRQVIEALDRLRAGGSTAGAAGIELAYQVAAENFMEGGVNRVILCTDGDFNVGISDDGSLTRLIEEKAKTGVFLSVLGFGTGNYQDSKMQQLADKGNGNHAYIDSILEARKVLGEEMSSTLVTIAKDVKIQLFFNPRRVAGFRLIGYENRLLAKQDFNDDTKDAGEIGAGHCVTALYEIVPAGADVPAAPPADENPFLAKPAVGADSDALFQLRIRYQRPGKKSELLEEMVRDGGGSYDAASADFRFASAVAAFGMNLRGTAGLGLDAVLEIAKGAVGDDKYRQEFLKLVETAKLLRR